MPVPHKVKKFLHKNFAISGVFSDHEFDQTDFGRIYFNMPEITEHPKTIEQLAATLKHYNKIGKPVKIRNTGHSVNGQTLTDGVQINIGGLDHVTFNKSKMEVTAGAGAAWDKVLKTIGFPKYCLPVFPNNPNQEIHIGGTVAAGGIGPYSKTQGGLWHHVLEITLVTMTGDVLKCSRIKNSEYFYFSLGGFGRIGVIAEVKVRVVPSLNSLTLLGAYYTDSQIHSDNLNKLAQDDTIIGAMAGVQLSTVAKMEMTNHFLFSLFEKNSYSAKRAGEYFCKEYPSDFCMFGYGQKSQHSNFELSFQPKKIPKDNLVYWYPEPSGEDQLGGCHVWCDCAIPKSAYGDFIKRASALVYEYGMEKFLIKESFFHAKVNVAFIGVYMIKNIDPGLYPLCLSFPYDDYFFGVVVEINCPRNKTERALEFSRKFTNLLYDMGGKHYLYCLHSLTKLQIDQHYGRGTINKWQKIKDQLDSKHLLNIGVIEHLD